MNVLGQYSSGLVHGSYSLLNRAASLVYTQPEEQVPLFDGSTLPQSVFARVAPMLDKLVSGDTEHLIKCSINPHYEIPDPVVMRLKSSGIMNEVSGELDPQAVKVAESINLLEFHAFGSGAAGKGAALCEKYYGDKEFLALREGRPEEAKKWMEWGLAAKKLGKYIRTYAVLTAYEDQKINLFDFQTCRSD